MEIIAFGQSIKPHKGANNSNGESIKNQNIVKDDEADSDMISLNNGAD